MAFYIPNFYIILCNREGHAIEARDIPRVSTLPLPQLKQTGQCRNDVQGIPEIRALESSLRCLKFISNHQFYHISPFIRELCTGCLQLNLNIRKIQCSFSFIYINKGHQNKLKRVCASATNCSYIYVIYSYNDMKIFSIPSLRKVYVFI